MEANNFLYNGKELQEDLDLNRYDYGLRTVFRRGTGFQ